MKITKLILLVLLCNNMFAQITITSESLPEIGDQLEYTTFANYEDTISYRQSGEDMQWSFDGFDVVASNIESYFDIQGNPLADTFPEANMLLQFGGFESAALLTDSSLSVIGVVVNDFTGLGVEANVNLQEGFRVRKTPFNFGEKIEDSLSVQFSIDASIIPGLDSLDLGFPGTTIDSIRITTEISKTEEAIGWGTVSILGDDIEALQILQEDANSTSIEFGLLLFGNRLWINAADIFGDMVDAFGGNQSSITYKFLSADDKRSIVEFNENTVVTDTLGNTMLVVNGRTSSELLSDIENIKVNDLSMIISPNPAFDIIKINLETNQQLSTLSLYNMNGIRVLYRDFNSASDTVDVSHLPSGSYTLSLESPDNIYSQKVMIIR